MKKETMFNTPDYEALDYLFNTIYKQMVSCNLLCDKYIEDNDCELAKEIKESNPFSIISLMQIKNFIVTNTPTDGCDDCAYLSMDTDAVVNVCPECAEERS